MTAPQCPSDALATREAKAAVWAAIAPPAHLSVDGIMAVTGLSRDAVFAVLAAGRNAGCIEIHDDDRQDIWIGRK